MALPTVTTIRLSPKGPIRVGAELRLSGDSFIACHIYTDHPPILQVEDEHVSVSISPCDPQHVTADDVAQATGLQHAMQDGASSDEFTQAVQTLGLKLEGGACGYPNMFADWLNQWGPFMVAKDINPGFHAVVISGIHGDGTADYTYLDQNDPAAGVNTIYYKDFVQQYEGGAAFTLYFAHR